MKTHPFLNHALNRIASHELGLKARWSAGLQPALVAASRLYTAIAKVVRKRRRISRNVGQTARRSGLGDDGDRRDACPTLVVPRLLRVLCVSAVFFRLRFGCRTPRREAFGHACASFVLALVGAVLLGGCGQPGVSPGPTGADTKTKPKVIGVSLMNLSSEFIVMLNQAMDAKARELKVKLIVNDAQRGPERQVQQVESFIAQKVDAIILNPCEVEASSPAVDKALAAGIPIVNVNSETKSAPTAFIGSRDEESGRMAMDFIAQRLHGQGNVVMMQGFLGQAAQIKRDQGAREVLAKQPGLKLLAVQTAEWDRAKALTLMENWIQSYGTKIQAVFAQNDEMGMGAVLALEQAKLKDKIIVASVDAIADALQAVKDGRLDATVFQDARGQGGSAVETAVKLLHQQPYEKQVFIPFRLVTKENVDPLLKAN
jgi:inositol transport system substrate-binding protein